MRVLVSTFELNFVTTAFRGNLAGEMCPVRHGHWINECYPSWFATCQVDPMMPFSRGVVRAGGDWIYVELDSYLAWRDTAFRAALDERASRSQSAPTPVSAPLKPSPAEATPASAEDAGSSAQDKSSAASPMLDEATAEPSNAAEPSRSRPVRRRRKLLLGGLLTT